MSIPRCPAPNGVSGGSNPRITELQLGSYAAMDDYHYLMEPRFHRATTAVVTVISRRRDRVVLDLRRW